MRATGRDRGVYGEGESAGGREREREHQHEHEKAKAKAKEDKNARKKGRHGGGVDKVKHKVKHKWNKSWFGRRESWGGTYYLK